VAVAASFLPVPIKATMRYTILLIAALTIVPTVNAQWRKKKEKPVCSADCEAANGRPTLSCKLTTPELRQRRETVIASLKAKVVSRKELANGYLYTFPGSDAVVDELFEFVKTERECCAFFVFNLSISGDKSVAKLEITGPKGAKEFITTEMAL